MTATTAPAGPRTQRVPDAWAGPGATRQNGGNLPLYRCTSCGAEVVWATSTRTGRRYLANVYRGQRDQRYYRGDAPHPNRDVCAAAVQAQRDQLEQRHRITELQRAQADEIRALRQAGADNAQLVEVVNRYSALLAPLCPT